MMAWLLMVRDDKDWEIILPFLFPHYTSNFQYKSSLPFYHNFNKNTECFCLSLHPNLIYYEVPYLTSWIAGNLIICFISYLTFPVLKVYLS